MNKKRGFTLIEIVIALAIIGILVAIAVPSYQSQLRKGRRADAQAHLVNLANKQQQYILDARTYALGGTALTDLGAPAPTSVTQYYLLAVTPAAPSTPPTFTLFATPIAGSVQEPDGILTIDSAGAKQRLVGGVDKGW